MKKLNLFILIIVIFTVYELNSLTLILKRVALINNPIIKIADLVDRYDGEISDYQNIENIIIAELPYQNRMMNISSMAVMNKIKLLNPNLDITISSTITAVRWEERNLSRDRIEKEATDFLTMYYSLSPEAEITYTSIPTINIPSENVILSYEMSRTTQNTNYVRLDIKVLYEGNIINVFNVLARVQEQIYVLQANRSIRKGQQIENKDFIRVLITANPNNSFISVINENDDLVANNFISNGSYLRNKDIIDAPYIQRNSMVTVFIRSSSMNLSYEALSRTDGWLGDRIMLQNPDSMQNFYAVVIDKNKVLINLEN